MQVGVGATIDVPAVRVVQKLPLDVVEFRAWLEVRPVGSGNVVKMDADYVLGMAQS